MRVLTVRGMCRVLMHAVQNTNVDGGTTKASWKEHSNTLEEQVENSHADKNGYPDRENSICNNSEI